MATEIKVSAASVGSLVASLGIALLNGVVADSSMLGSWPAWLQFVVLMCAPTLITFLLGYVTPSATSTVSDAYTRIDEVR